MPTVFRTRASRSDVVEIVLRIRRGSPKAAKRVLDAINDTIQLLAAFPTLGPRREELAPSLRSFPANKYTDYIIFYRLTSSGIEVIRVMHGGRDLARQFRQ
jgi:toxin ParE1/3/4